MTGEGKRIARTRLLKKIGLIGLISTSAILVVILVISLLPRGKAAFTIRVDTPSSERDFVMSTTKEGKATNFVKADPLKKAFPTKASKVEDYLYEVDHSETGLSGQQNFVRTYQSPTKDGQEIIVTDELALVYTVYLANTSAAPITVRYTVNLDGYKSPENSNSANELLTYVRILMQTETVGNPNSLSNVYYGQRRTNEDDRQYPTELGTFEEDGREPISGYDSTEFDLRRVIKSDFKSAGNDGYCVSFNPLESGKDIVNHPDYSKVTINPNETVRCTFVCYFENEDVDCSGGAPKNAYMLLSLHFGN